MIVNNGTKLTAGPSAGRRVGALVWVLVGAPARVLCAAPVWVLCAALVWVLCAALVWVLCAALALAPAADAAKGVVNVVPAPHPPNPALSAARAADETVPYMGVDTWYAFGSNIDQADVVQYTNEVVRSGLKAAGYRIVWLDAGWWQGTRNQFGQIVVNPQQWPRGMNWLVSYIHSRGLLAGIYTDAGAVGCQNAGSYQHYQADVNTFDRWGFDAVKVDFCGGHELGLDPRAAYQAFARAIRDDQPHRPMLFAICNAALPGERVDNDPSYAESAFASYTFARSIATSWRTGPDVGVPGDVTFQGVLQNIPLDARHPEAAGGGHWNDPDYLVPDQGMTQREARAQLTMWAILAAPLMLSANIAQMPSNTLRMYENPKVIGIDQDTLGVQGREVRWDRAISVWVKPLSGRRAAVAFLNRGPRGVAYTTTASMLGLTHLLGLRRGEKLAVENVWTHRTRRTKGSMREFVHSDATVLIEVSIAPGS